MKILAELLSNPAEIRMSEPQATAPKRHCRSASSSKPDWSSVFAWLWRYGLIAVFILSFAHLGLLSQQGRLIPTGFDRPGIDWVSALFFLLLAYTALCGYFLIQVAVWSDYRISVVSKLLWLLVPLVVVGPVCFWLLVLTCLAA